MQAPWSAVPKEIQIRHMPGKSPFAGIGSVYALESFRAKIVIDLKELDRHSYCGHSALIGKKKRQRDRVWARDLLCYWCAIELGIPVADLAKRLDLTLAAVSCAIKRGDMIAKQSGCHLDD